MSHLRIWALLFFLSFAFPSISAFALPGEANAVVQHCGAPDGEHQGISPVSSVMQRDLSYKDVILHFQTADGGWSFTTAWHGHRPLTRNELEIRMPCFRDAMNEVAAAPRAVIDPSIAAQGGPGPRGVSNSYGMPVLWWIGGLTALILVFVALPRTKRHMKRADMPMETRPYRKPQVIGSPFRRKPAIAKPTDL